MKQRLFWLTTLLVVSMIPFLISCQSKPTSTSPPITTINTSPSATTAPSQRVFGTITQINNNTLTLTTQQGITTVAIGSGAIIQMTSNGTTSDLHTGDTLSVMGNQDANGNITATSITVLPQGQGIQQTRIIPTTTFSRRTPPTTGNSTNPRFPSGFAGNGTYGTLTQINGNTLTLTTMQGTVNVTISSDTSILLTETGTLSDLHTGQSIIITGSGNAQGNLTANYIIIQPQSQSVPQNQGPVSSNPSSTPASSSVSTANVNIGIYSDIECTQPITNIEFGSLQQGTSSTQRVFLKDLGDQDVTVTANSTGLTNDLTLTGGSLTLSPGLTSTGVAKVFEMALVLSAGDTAATGDYNFTINFNSLKIPSHVDVIGTPSSSTPMTTSTTS